MEKEILENSKLIAEFMGMKNISSVNQHPEYKDQEGDYWFPERMEYHLSWNWLMPVVEKIAKLQFKPVEVINNGEDSYYDNIYPRTFGMVNADTRKFMVRLNKFPLHQSNSLIEATYYAVIEFIEWYNKQNSHG